MFNKNKKIYFSKMHGLGNDFVVIDKINQSFKFSRNIIQKLSNRNLGIGFDQLLFVERTKDIKYDFFYRIFNFDGTEVSQCGNGARCISYFLILKKITHKKDIIIQTYNSIMKINFINKNNITVNMGIPIFKFNNNKLLKLKNLNMYNIMIDAKNVQFDLINVGNPHCVIIVNDINNCEIDKIGVFLNKQLDIFDKGINVNFMQIISHNKVMLRVYERGVGETLACGSGACASVMIGIKQHLLSNSVTVNLPGGNLEIFWDNKKNNIYMTGPSEHVYDGYIYCNY